ncbi:hypothetical protein LXL04_036724 [Taraxacum kok-saghyz]
MYCMRLNLKTDHYLARLCNASNSTTPEITKNINSFLPKLLQATTQFGYSATSIGHDQSQVFGLAQCRADISTDDCSACIQEAIKEIRSFCTEKVDARVWYDYCFIRYNTENFIGKLDTNYGSYYWNVENVTNPKTFNQGLGSLMDKINAVAGASVQCTGDLSELSCRQCLAIAVGKFPAQCENSKGCRVLYSSCYVRYELYPFNLPLDKKAAPKSSSMTNYRSVVAKF